MCGRERVLVSRTLDRHAAVHDLLQAGHSQREAAEILGLSRNTVNRFAREPGAARLLTRPGRLGTGDWGRLAAVTASCPHLDALAGHIRSFAEMMTRRQGLLALEDWLTRVEADDQPQLHSFAHGIRRGQQAVTAGLALPYSSAAMEGNVNKIKMIKRQMYGRVGFPLLSKRVILHPA